MNEIKIIPLILLLFFSAISCNFTTEKHSSEKENSIISKIKYKKNTSGTDTLWVSQNDISVFRQEEVMISRPCSNPELQMRYELINPRNEAYYFIYNNKKQLVTEGKYTNEYTYEGQTYKRGDFYNVKSYYYKSNGNLKSIHYMKDGRNHKTELFDNKKRLTEIMFYDQKTGDRTKVEIYDKGQLEETHIYTSFDDYYTVKADN
ncbi:hypothetical protein [Flavobacterium ajazii]|uniref:hypothetical protein n=1 Tax=Flavobacterium ajazii TaxID=2692318 RepID=UPI0013D79960|nr:hypothetical protein [Flavobacterium ajazii]